MISECLNESTNQLILKFLDNSDSKDLEESILL